MPVRFRILASSGADAGVPSGPSVERIVDVTDGLPEIRLGRRADLELPLPFATLSSVHARLVRDGQDFVLEDAGSTNGTSLDGLRLDPGERRPVEPGAELRLADVRIRFEGPVSEAAMAARPPAGTVDGTATIARRLVSDLLGSARAGVPALAVTRGAAARRLPLAELDRRYLVGRAESCALPLDVEEVSREHAAFVRDAAGVVVRDLGSKNGVVLRGARIEGERRLADGDVVEVGPVTLTLEDPVERYLRELAQAPEAVAPVEPAVMEPAASSLAASPRASTMSRLSVVVGILVIAVAAATAIAMLL